MNQPHELFQIATVLNLDNPHRLRKKYIALKNV